MEKITIKELKSEGGMLWIGLDDLSQDVEVVTQESIKADLLTSRKEGAEEVLNHFRKIEKEKWKDATHCSCLGYAIHQYVHPDSDDCKGECAAIEGINIDEA